MVWFDVCMIMKSNACLHDNDTGQCNDTLRSACLYDSNMDKCMFTNVHLRLCKYMLVTFNGVVSHQHTYIKAPGQLSTRTEQVSSLTFIVDWEDASVQMHLPRCLSIASDGHDRATGTIGSHQIG